MIGRLRGEIAGKQPPQLLIDVNGVGYEVEAPMSTFYSLPKQGEQVTLLIHMIVREDAQLLYGFLTNAERQLFRDLIKISGVGGKLALTILSGISANDFTATIQAGDSARLTQLPGVGKKTAERLVIEMRHKLGKEPATLPEFPGDTGVSNDPVSEAHGALVSLGYKPAEATKMLAKVSVTDQISEELIRQALQSALK